MQCRTRVLGYAGVCMQVQILQSAVKSYDTMVCAVRLFYFNFLSARLQSLLCKRAFQIQEVLLNAIGRMRGYLTAHNSDSKARGFHHHGIAGSAVYNTHCVEVYCNSFAMWTAHGISPGLFSFSSLISPRS